MNRRTFLKYLGVGAAGVATGKVLFDKKRPIDKTPKRTIINIDRNKVRFFDSPMAPEIDTCDWVKNIYGNDAWIGRLVEWKNSHGRTLYKITKYGVSGPKKIPAIFMDKVS